MVNGAKDFVKNRTMGKQLKNLLDEDLEDETEAKQMHIEKNNFTGKPSPELAKAFKEAKAAKESEALPAKRGGGMSDFSSRLDFFFMGENVRMHSPRDNEFWFCAADVCKVLDYKDPAQAIKAHCLGEPMKHAPENSPKPLLYIKESDLYNLILRSSSPKAISFRKLVTEKILPEIRASGKCIITKEIHERVLQAAAETLPAQGEQLEMFPITAKPDITFPKPVVKILSSARKHLAEGGTTFKTYADFLGYLIKRGLDEIDLRDVELDENWGKAK